MEGTPGKTLLDKPAVAPKLPETDFFNGLLMVCPSGNVSSQEARDFEYSVLARGE
jgi:hypothetical protein